MRLTEAPPVQFLAGLFAKARLILLFMVFAVVALIWSDQLTRGLFG